MGQLKSSTESEDLKKKRTNVEANLPSIQPENKIKRPKHVQVSIAQYMFKNIHLLGFENSQRVLNVAIRELMDNSLDAANQHMMNPTIDIEIQPLKNKFYKICFKDEGPGIAPEIVPKVCCKLLYGNKFVDNVPQRGQQGLGLTALILYAQKTSGIPARIISKTKESLTNEFLLTVNLKNNTPVIVKRKIYKPEESFFKGDSGFYVELVFEAQYIKKGPRATNSFLEQYCFLNPNLELNFKGPEDTSFSFQRLTEEPMKLGTGVKAVPHHLSIGELNLIIDTDNKVKDLFLEKLEGQEFLIKKVLDESYIPYNMKANMIPKFKLEALLENFKVLFKDAKPSQDCLADLGPTIRKAVTKNEALSFDKIIFTKSDIVYYQKGALKVEACAFYGSSDINKDQKITLYRVANGTPLINQGGSCCITKSVIDFDWKKTGLTHIQNELPRGNLVLFIHVNSTKTPYITESKDAIADVLEIRTAITSCLNQLSRKIHVYMKKEEFYKILLQKKVIIERVLPDFLNTLKEGLNRDFKGPLDLEYLQAQIYDLVCFFEYESCIKCINGTKKMKSFKYKVNGNWEHVVLDPGKEVTLEVKGLELDEISPIDYFYIKRK